MFNNLDIRYSWYCNKCGKVTGQSFICSPFDQIPKPTFPDNWIAVSTDTRNHKFFCGKCSKKILKKGVDAHLKDKNMTTKKRTNKAPLSCLEMIEKVANG